MFFAYAHSTDDEVYFLVKQVSVSSAVNSSLRKPKSAKSMLKGLISKPFSLLLPIIKIAAIYAL